MNTHTLRLISSLVWRMARK